MNIDIQFEESNQVIDLDFGEIQIVGGSENIAVIEPLTVTENGTYTAHGDVDGYSPVYVNVPIPEGYIQPQGTVELTENGEYVVTEYANAIVNVEEPKEEQEKTIDITENGTTEVTPDDGKVLSKVTVNVDVEKSITPSGTLEITENGEYDVTEYASANVNVVSGGSDNPLQYATMTNGLNLFREAVFPENYHLFYRIKGNASSVNFNLWFAYSNVQKVTLKLDTMPTSLYLPSAFVGCTKLTEVTFENGVISPYSLDSAFVDCRLLEVVNGTLDLSKSTSHKTPFSKCYVLREIRFVENSIEKSLSFVDCSSLSAESIQSIIDGLATVETQQTVTFWTTVKNALTEEQKATITSKNWNLA